MAHDSVLIKIIKQNSDRNEPQTDINNINSWSLENELSLNPNKTELLSIETEPEVLTCLYKINEVGGCQEPIFLIFGQN